jgi:hypothetical protein
MSVATRATLSIVEKSSWYLFYPSSSAGSSSSSTLALSSSKHQDDLLWLWTAVGLGCLGFKLCNDALELYQFCTAWNQVWRRNRIDVEGKMKDSKENLKRRRLQIERSLTTLTFGELLQKQQQLFFGNKKGDETSTATKQQQQQNETMEHRQPQEAQHHTSCSKGSKKCTPSFELEETCVVCLADFEADDQVSCSKNFFNKNASCKHIFHSSCLRAWLIKHVSCPVCRHRMVPDPETLPWSPDL